MNYMIKIFRALLAVLIVAGMFCSPILANELDSLKYPPLNKLEIPKVEKETLKNGLRLYFITDKSLPTFEASVRVNCGSYLEPSDKTGLASMCGSVMRTGGTKKWTGDQLDELLEGIGGSVETSIGTINGRASVSVLSEYSDLGLEVLSQVLRYPVFDEDKIELAKVQERTGISRRNDEPMPILIREFRKLIYGPESPYASVTEYATINAITRDDLIAFHDKYFQPENIQIAIWGDFNKKDVLKKINKYFGDWQKGSVDIPKPPKVDYAFENKVYLIKKEDLPQTNILIGHIGGYTLDEDYPARIVMNSIFGGSFGSRLTDNVRSKEGLAYSAGGQYTANIEYPGLFYAYAFTKPQSTVKAIREMVKQIKSMQTDPPTDMEMKKGKDGFLNSFVFNFDTKAEVVNRMMTYDFYGLPEDLLFKRKEAVEHVTKDDVVQASLANLHPDQLKILVIGNFNDFNEPLDSLGMGEPEVIDITIPSGETKSEVSASPENLKKGHDLLMAMANALGGIENYGKVKAMSQKGTLSIVTPQGEFPIMLDILESYPDKSRAIINMMGRELYDIRNGDKGWKANQAGELVPKTAEDIANDNKDMTRSTVYIMQNLDGGAFKAVYDGSGKVGETPVEYVTLLDNAGGNICRLAINPDNGMLISKSYWGESMMGQGTIEEIYENMTDVNGIKIPMTVRRTLDGQPLARLVVQEVKVNPDIPEGAFEKPE